MPKQIAVYLDDDTFERFGTVAWQQRKTKSQLVREIVSDFLSKHGEMEDGQREHVSVDQSV